MRVQHNIAAMNSYRNYNNNTSMINKNLEKLSSGYKINRAGDDAAGLAISEKMRAQITGLEVAQKNAKDGISLVQTAEGALTEVHSMLNRMYELAEQSANGTYEGLDREQLQKEVGKLRTEIDRIADSANFNGIKLLDGSMEAEGGKFVSYDGKTNADGSKTAASKEVDTVTTGTITTAAGDKVSVEITYRDLNNTIQTYGIDFTVDSSSKYVTDDKLGDKDLLKAIQNVVTTRGGTLDDTFSISGGVYTAKNAGDGKGQVLSMNVKVNGADKGVSTVARTTMARDEFVTFDAKNLAKVYNGGTADPNDSIFEVNGYRFAYATSGNLNKFASDVNVIQTAGTSIAVGADITNAVATINRVIGRDVAVATSSSATTLEFTSNVGDALKLQIGDTAESFNQMEVSITDMHAGALGISGIDISTATGGAEAMNAIKAAINKVSENRGTLGATQNRLDHTINNLSVMQENMQDAESTIRDTDVAAEMMKYTKNSILVQSAQAMLAQANQQPQGVLQLLQ